MGEGGKGKMKIHVAEFAALKLYLFTVSQNLLIFSKVLL